MSKTYDPEATRQCEVCDLYYVPSLDRAEHARKHKRFLELSKRYAEPCFGELLWVYWQREYAKRGRDEPGSEYNIERHMYALYCRFVLTYDRTLPLMTFAEYIAAMHNTYRSFMFISKEEIDFLEAKYGRAKQQFPTGRSH